MPYKSDKQRRYFNANREKLEAQGVDVDEWNEASKGKDLPEKAAFTAALGLGTRDELGKLAVFGAPQPGGILQPSQITPATASRPTIAQQARQRKNQSSAPPASTAAAPKLARADTAYALGKEAAGFLGRLGGAIGRNLGRGARATGSGLRSGLNSRLGRGTLGTAAIGGGAYGLNQSPLGEMAGEAGGEAMESLGNWWHGPSAGDPQVRRLYGKPDSPGLLLAREAEQAGMSPDEARQMQADIRQLAARGVKDEDIRRLFGDNLDARQGQRGASDALEQLRQREIAEMEHRLTWGGGSPDSGGGRQPDGGQRPGNKRAITATSDLDTPVQQASFLGSLADPEWWQQPGIGGGDYGNRWQQALAGGGGLLGAYLLYNRMREEEDRKRRMEMLSRQQPPPPQMPMMGGGPGGSRSAFFF